MATPQQSRGSSIGVLGLLGVMFVTLKLAGVIAWSWWWVTLPFWGAPALMVAVLCIAAVGVGVIDWLEGREKRRV